MPYSNGHRGQADGRPCGCRSDFGSVRDDAILGRAMGTRRRAILKARSSVASQWMESRPECESPCDLQILMCVSVMVCVREMRTCIEYQYSRLDSGLSTTRVESTVVSRLSCVARSWVTNLTSRSLARRRGRAVSGARDRRASCLSRPHARGSTHMLTPLRNRMSGCSSVAYSRHAPHRAHHTPAAPPAALRICTSSLRSIAS